MGPVNISEVIQAGFNGTNIKYFDRTFEGRSSIYWEEYAPGDVIYDFETNLDSGYYYFERWPKVFSHLDIFHAGYDPAYDDANQGPLGNCYFVSAMSSIAEYPELIKNAFLTQEKNEAGIIGLRFYIRGKPWYLDIDDRLLF